RYTHPLRFFLSHDTPTTDIYPLSLHDALPILGGRVPSSWHLALVDRGVARDEVGDGSGDHRRDDHRELAGHLRNHHDDRDRRLRDRKSTRLNSSHVKISYAVFCLKKKKTNNKN